jgi:hypothetical protein
MQSLLRVWSLHRSVLFFAGACLATGAARRAAAQAAPPAETPPASGDSARDAQAPAGRVILLLRTRGDDDTITSLRFELGEGGYRILEVRSDARLATEPLGAVAEREQVAAAVRVDAAGGRVELWVRDDAGPVEEMFSAGSEPSSAHVLAVRVAEALRARGLLLPPPPSPAPETLPAPPPVARKTPPDTARAVPRSQANARTPARFSIEVGPGLVLSPGGLEPFAVVELGLRLEFSRIWSVSAFAAIPISRQSLQAVEGEALLASSLAGALLELEWARLPFGGVRTGLGAGASVTSMSGRAASGFEGADDTVVAFTPLARTSFHVDIGPRLRLRTALTGGFTLPEIHVAFGEREVASWGHPFGLASVALEASPL